MRASVIDVLQLLARAPRIDLRCLVVAPHPDDETIGAGGVLQKMSTAFVICLTDGAPSERRFWTARYATREAYAEVRLGELARALAIAGVTGERVRCLGVRDQECTWQLAPLVRELVAALRRARPDVVLVTPYEGGHPDHDAAAFACRAAVERLRDAGEPEPSLVEMTSYHWRDASLQTGAFLGSGAVVERRLDKDDEAGKRRMMQAYGSQARVLTPFRSDVERFRLAPRYDFTRPPHAAPLFYEALGWPMTSARWCAAAAAAARELHIEREVS